MAAAESVKIMDYFYPLSQEAEWTYLEPKKNGELKATQVRCSPNHQFTLFDIRNGNLIEISRKAAWLRYFGGNYVDGAVKIHESKFLWQEFYGMNDRYAIYGGDYWDSQTYVRFGPEAIFPKKFRIPQTISVKSHVFNDEGQQGPDVTFSAKLLRKESVTVPAATFPDCLHFRFTSTFKGGPTSISEEWWAKGVGIVKTKTRDANGKTSFQKLYSYKFFYSPTLDFVNSSSDFGRAFVDQPDSGSIYSKVIRTLSVKNKGKSIIPGLAVSVTGSDSFTGELISSGKLAPDETASIKVIFAPAIDGIHKASIKVQATDNPENSCILHIHGIGDY